MYKKNIVIYGAGESGNELFQSILLDPSKRLLAFFDDSNNLKNLQINENIALLEDISSTCTCFFIIKSIKWALTFLDATLIKFLFMSK